MDLWTAPKYRAWRGGVEAGVEGWRLACTSRRSECSFEGVRMVDVALVLLGTGAMSLGCIHSWRYLARVHGAAHDDREARRWARSRCRRQALARDDTMPLAEASPPANRDLRH